MHTAPYFTAFGLMTILHSWRVVELRRSHKVGLGHGGLELLERRVRIFGNLVEYASIGLILLAALEFVQAPTWYLHLCGITLLLGRITHAIGLGKSAGASRERVAGMVLTYVSLFLASIGISLFTLVGP